MSLPLAAALRAIGAALLDVANTIEAAPAAEAADELVDAHGASALGVSRKAFRAICRKGIVPARRDGRRFVVRRGDLLVWLNGRGVPIQPAPTAAAPKLAPTTREAVRAAAQAQLAAGKLRSIRGGK